METSLTEKQAAVTTGNEIESHSFPEETGL
jgi:hypothetical protein